MKQKENPHSSTTLIILTIIQGRQRNSGHEHETAIATNKQQLKYCGLKRQG